RRAFLQLPPDPKIIPPFSQPEADAEDKKNKRRWWRPRLVLLLLLLLLLGLLIWLLLGRNQPQTAMDTEPFPCCIEQVSGIPTGTFTYTAEAYGAWDYILEQPNLIAKDTTLAAELYQRQPKLELNYQPVPTWTEAIAQVREEEAEFVIATPINRLGFSLDAEEVAHDGLVFFVAFSYAQRENSLPAALNGQISFEQLRLLYTGEITNWQELGGPDLPVQLYVPPSDQAIELFKQRVLQQETNTSNSAKFEALVQQRNQPSRSFANLGRPPIIRTQTFETLRQVIRDFEQRNIGAIGFDSLSKVLGQCSVYPLAIVDGENDPISPLVQDNQQPITPDTDLCNAKGSYGANVEAFIRQTYPLAYPLAVIYPRDNSRPPIGTKFAEILQTEEAQCLLSKTGLVPLRPYLDSTFCTQELGNSSTQ
ncbi:MAG: substrate-binding domain-containing protein, partial [Coleofasciculus sp. C2-GNP5-27]